MTSDAVGFFFNEVAAKPRAVRKVRTADIPAASLQALGCSVCPRDKDAKALRSPRMEPSGPRDASVYLLGAAPTQEEDEDNNHWTDKAGDAVYRAFGRDFMEREVRSNFITGCRGDQTAVEIECCRPRVVADIEAVKPLLVVGIGDPPLNWILAGEQAVTALTHRGSLFVTKIGKHVCWFYSILYPSFVHKKGYGRSEYELALLHDVAEIKRLVRELEPAKVSSAPYDAGIEIITGNEPGDMQRLEKALLELAPEPKSGIDLECTGLRPWLSADRYHKSAGAMILTCSVGTFDRTVAFAVDHPEGWGSAAQRKKVKALLFNYLLKSGRKAAHNLAMELEWLGWEFGNEFLRRTEWDDTMAMAHTLDERPGTKSLDFQCRKHFGFWLKKLSNLDAGRLLDYPLKQVLKYNGMDCKWTDGLRDRLAPLVAAENQAEYDRKVRLAPTLTITESVGLGVDFDYAREMEKKFNGISADLEARISRCPEVREFGRRFGTFQPTNPDDVLKMLKDISKRDEIRVEDRKTKAIRWTTDEEALSKIPAQEVPSVPLILEHRGSSKLVGTYIEPVLRRKIVCRDGLIRSKYSSMVAVTGRLASEDPNAQNWPKRKHREIRGMIRTRRGWLVACDYGQIEFRVVGMASEDENLVRACWTGYDVHKFWAQRMIKLHGPIVDWIVTDFADTLAAIKAKEGKEYDEDKAILKTLRQEAKNKWVFPQLFGASLRMCAEQLHLPEEIAAELGQEFWDEFPDVKRWQEKLLKNYERNLYVETLGGRKRRGPMTKNEIINHPIQGTACDIVLEGMNSLSEKADIDEDPDLQPVVNVHDDLTFDMPDESLETKIPIIAREMCLPRFDYINVPLVVEVSIGERWDGLEEIKVYRSDVLFSTPNPYS
jgi:uracil-DNA glycosylase family 4